MPKLDNIIADRKKRRFKKKEYRPWDLAGNSADLETNGDDTSKQTDNKQITNREQPDNTQITIREQSGNNQITTREQLGNITEHQIDNETGNREYLIGIIKKLTGIQKNIFLYVLNISLTQDQLNIDNILTREMSVAIGASYGSTKTSIKRLVNKGVLVRNKGKACRCGHINLGITKIMRTVALEAYKNNFHTLSGNITGNKIENNQLDSSSIYNTNTIGIKNMPQSWLEINFEPIQHIGFSLTQLRQLYEKNLSTPEVIQESINHFAFGLENNEKIKGYTHPLNVLMGVLRKGNAWIESNYESPIDMSIKQLMKFRKQQEEKRKAQMDELFLSYFNPWYEQQTDSFLKTLIPKTMRNNYKRSSPMIFSAAKEYYKSTKEWQEVLGKLG